MAGARRLVERGANTPLREAAALGLMERVEGGWTGDDDPPDSEDITQAFWYACHGGQQPAAEYLLDRGAHINWVSTWDHLTPLDAAQRSEAGELAEDGADFSGTGIRRHWPGWRTACSTLVPRPGVLSRGICLR